MTNKIPFKKIQIELRKSTKINPFMLLVSVKWVRVYLSRLQSRLQNMNYPIWLPYTAFNMSNENLVVHQDNSFLVIYLLDNFLILYGKTSYRSLLEINALNIVNFVIDYCCFTSHTKMIHNLLHVRSVRRLPLTKSVRVMTIHSKEKL